MINSIRSMQIFKQESIIAVLLALAITSCNPQEKTTVAPVEKKYQFASGSAIDAERVNNDIKNFYQKVKDLKTGFSSENISADDALFLIEGTYNKYVAERQFNCDVVKYEFLVKAPVNTDGTLSMKNVSNAFYAIKDSMLVQKKRLGGNEVGVESFDMDIAERPTGVNNGSLYFDIITIYKKPKPGFPIDMTEWCSDNFHEADDHLWSTAAAQSNPLLWSYDAQATLNYATKQIVPGTLDETLPGAPKCLRAKGVGNYQKFYCKSMVCGYFVNISQKVTDSGYVLSNPVSQYATLGMTAFTNKDIYTAKILSANETWSTMKQFLTTPMMNFYLARIPFHIQQNIAPGKEFANFHIEGTANIGAFPVTVVQRYFIYSGNFIATPGGDCTGKLELGYL